MDTQRGLALGSGDSSLELLFRYQVLDEIWDTGLVFSREKTRRLGIAAEIAVSS